MRSSSLLSGVHRMPSTLLWIPRHSSVRWRSRTVSISSSYGLLQRCNKFFIKVTSRLNSRVAFSDATRLWSPLHSLSQCLHSYPALLWLSFALIFSYTLLSFTYSLILCVTFKEFIVCSALRLKDYNRL